MKKLIAFVLAFTMVAAMAAPALAEEDTTTDNNKTSVTDEGLGANILVHGTYQGPQDVISVDVVWDAMDFIYTDASEGTWNPATHQYEYPTEEGWSWKGASETQTAPEIKLSNHSNVGVKAAFGFTASEGLENLTGSFTGLTDNAFTLPTAVNTALAEAPSKATAFSLSGTGITEESKELGKITVTISKDDSTTPDTPTVTEVKDAQELIDAINAKESVKLTDDINVQWPYTGTAMGVDAYPGTIDLNKHTLTTDTEMQIAKGSNATINNGTVKGSSSFFVTIKDENTNVTMNNCSLENSSDSASSSAVYVENGTVLLNDCTLTCNSGDYALKVENGNVTLSGNTTFNTNNRTTSPVLVQVQVQDGGKLTCLAGTYNFDPTDYVDDTKFDVNENAEEGSWTVTAKTPSEG